MLNLDLPDYSHVTPILLLLYVLAGIMGALVRVAWLDKPLRGLYRDEDGGLHMGFFAEVIIAVGVAITIDGHPVRAGIAAVFAPFILDAAKDFITSQLPTMLTNLAKKKEESDNGNSNDDS